MEYQVNIPDMLPSEVEELLSILEEQAEYEPCED